MTAWNYPPDVHLLADLGVEIDADEERTAARIPVTPELLGPDGGVHAGVIATLVDIVGGVIAVRVLHPDWMATADMSLQVVRPATGPVLEAQGTVVRHGRTTLVLEVFVFDVPDDGEPVAWSTLTFAVLPRAADAPEPDDLPGLPRRSVFGPAQLAVHVLEAVSIADAGGAEGMTMPVGDYVRNTIGGLQGGVVALFAEVAGARAVAAALGTGRPSVAVELQVSYIALGRVGPMVARVRSVTADPTTGSGRGVVELRDAGADDRLTTVVAVGAVSA